MFQVGDSTWVNKETYDRMHKMLGDAKDVSTPMSEAEEKMLQRIDKENEETLKRMKEERENCLTVKDLIEWLKAFPQDTPVHNAENGPVTKADDFRKLFDYAPTMRIMSLCPIELINYV